LTVISLAQRRQERQDGNAGRLLAALSIEFPSDIYTEQGTGVAVLTDADWRVLNELFSAFEVVVPRAIEFTRLVDIWYYLSGEVGYHLQLYLKNPQLFKKLRGSREPVLLSYLDALVEGNRIAARALAAQMDIVNTCPVVEASAFSGNKEKTDL
jgi:hypothetical protein